MAGPRRAEVLELNRTPTSGEPDARSQAPSEQDQDPPTPGQQLDAAIHLETLNDVVYVGRPVFAQPNGYDVLYKLEPDGQHAVAVAVQYGRVSVNAIEVRSGLVPGDKVILSDMRRYTKVNRVQLK